MPKMLNGIRVVIINQLLTIPFWMLWYQLEISRPLDYGRDLPTMQRFLIDMAAFTLIEEAGFYYTHRSVISPLPR